MLNVRRILGTAGLGLLCGLFLMSFAIPSAQAANDWLVWNPGTFQDELVVQDLIVESKKDGWWWFTSKALGTTIKIGCEEAVLNTGKLGAEGRSSGSLAFSECETLLGGTASPLCQPVEPFSLALKSTSFVHGGKMYVLTVPAEGTSFGTITFEAECVLPEEIGIKGTMVGEYCDNIELYQLWHLYKATEGTLFGSGEHVNALKFGAEPLTLSGSIWLRLNNDREWKWMP